MRLQKGCSLNHHMILLVQLVLLLFYHPFFEKCYLQNIEPEQSGQIPDLVCNVIKGKYLMTS